MTEEYLELSEYLEFKTKLNAVLKKLGNRLTDLEEENAILRQKLAVFEQASRDKKPTTNKTVKGLKRFNNLNEKKNNIEKYKID